MESLNLTLTDRRVLTLLRLALAAPATETAPATEANSTLDKNLATEADLVRLFARMTTDDWKAVYTQAAKQGVMCLCWDGVCLLPEEVRPPRPLKLMWALEVQRYEERYARYVRTLGRLTDLYAAEGIRTVQLKGVGYSTYYPVPAHREGGDIDVYTFAAEGSSLTDPQANHRADELMRRRGIEVDTSTSRKHSHFEFENISIENHKMFLNADRYALAGRMNRVLHRLMQPDHITLACGPAAPGEQVEVDIAPAAFNAVFIPFHAAQHYGTGLALHHLVDCALVLRRTDSALPPEALAEPRFMQAVSALALLSRECLGIEPGTPLPPATNAARTLAGTMLKEMLHPTFARRVPQKHAVGILWYKTRRFVYCAGLGDRLLGMGLAMRVWQSVVAHLKRPATILGRGTD